jgi:hypothetical protein
MGWDEWDDVSEKGMRAWGTLLSFEERFNGTVIVWVAPIALGCDK